MIQIDFSLPHIVGRTVSTAFTLYMMLIIARWVAPALQLDTQSPWFRWVCRLTDPLINALRRVLPPVGSFDLAPIAALFVVWVAREIVMGILFKMN